MTTFVWAVLVAATCVSWLLGLEGASHASAQGVTSSAILIISFIKVRFVGVYFMELREAPAALRAVFEAYVVVVCALLIAFYALA